METAIIVVWSLGLIVALIATMVILKQVSMILGVLQGIHRLGEITRDAARGIAANVEVVPDLGSIDQPVSSFAAAAAGLRANVERLEQKLDMLAGARLPGGR